MAGTVEGGRAAAATNKAKYGKDFYAKIGAKGGRLGTTGGFAADVPCECSLIHGKHYVKNCAGMKGGRISRKPKHAN